MIVFALSSSHKLGLGLVALVWIIFSLVVAMIIPRRRPDFPGKNLPAFLALVAVFFVAMLAAVFVFGKESKGSEAAPATPTQTQTGITETTGGATQSTPTTGATGGADLAAGKAAFDKASCGGCHTLAAAKASGKVGPDLDTLKPDEATVEHQVTNGGASMPAFKGVLSDAEIKAVSAYVAQVAGKS